MNESEIDMDELETRLYGQVYHVSPSNEDLASSCNITKDTSNKNVPRYFEDHSSRSQNKVYQIRPPFYDTIGFYPFSPVNNIVVLPPPQPQIFARPQQDSQKWLEKLLMKYEKTREKRKQKRARRKKKLLEEKGEQNQQKDDVIEKVEETPSDASTNMSDVILVETPTEIISVDCEDMKSVESDSQEDVSENKDNFEAASCNSSTVDYTENFRDNKQLGDFNARASTRFTDLNLDSFTNYIECNGKTSDGIPTLSSMALEDNSKKQKDVIEYSSDSSSESELEDYGDELEDVSDISVTVDNQTDGTLKKGPTHTKVKDDDVISIDCDDDSPKSKKVKLVETEIDVVSLNQFSSTSTPKKEGDVIFIDDDSVSSTELCLQESDRVNINSHKILNVEGGSSVTYSGKNCKPIKFKDYWTEDMDKFYRDSWGHEEFSVIEEQRKMSDDPDMWKIISSDKINLNALSRELRCRRCREFGHIAVKCTKRLDPPKCILCAGVGHRESRCPYKLCTSSSSSELVLKIFKKRYVIRMKLNPVICFQTAEGPLVIQPLAACVKQVSDQWCAGCGANGHLEQNCGYYNRTHLPSSVFIHDYTDVYNGQVLPGPSLRSSKPQPSTKSQPSPKPATSQPSPKLLKPQPSTKSPKSQPSPKPAAAQPFSKIPKSKRLFKTALELNPEIEIRLKRSSLIETVMKTFNVDVTFNGHKCIIRGLKRDAIQSKEMIRRFFRNTGLYHQIDANFSFISNPSVHDSLQKNFNYLQNPYINWQVIAKNIYQTVKMNRSRIKFKQLNSIINAKLQLGNASHHMKILQQCLDTNSEVNKESFLYIFNNGNPIIHNYNFLIDRLPCKANDIIRVEIEKLKNEAVRVLNESDYKTIDRLHSLVIINNYSDSDVSKFVNDTRRLLSKVRAKKNVPKEKR
ncbi:hypothetical protein FQR65_LT09348 [Abscondita terminalis]|nr:hypothetical protein FQR65_LT09348 [Abscondita terminalis]